MKDTRQSFFTRRGFLKFLGIGTGVAIVAPAVSLDKPTEPKLVLPPPKQDEPIFDTIETGDSGTWGFDLSDFEDDFAPPPPGYYIMRIVDIRGPDINRNGDMYMMPVCEILSDVNDAWIGRKYTPYMALTPERIKYTKQDLLRMGASLSMLRDDGSPRDLVGLTFGVDLVHHCASHKDGPFCNMQNIKAVQLGILQSV